MIESSIARRYSRALVDLAKEEGQMDEVLASLEVFGKAIHDNLPLREALNNRFIDMASRLAIADSVLKKIGAGVLTTRFIKLFIRKGRIGLLNFLIPAYRKLVFEAQGKKEATVVSAKPLSDATYAELTKLLSEKMKSQIVLRREVKPDVLGGISVRVGGEVIDGTVRSRLLGLAEKMRQAI